MQRDGVDGARGCSGRRGLEGAEESSEDESEGGAVEPRCDEVKNIGDSGVTGASESSESESEGGAERSSSSVSQRGLFKLRFTTARVALACA